jgi:hypothetical protein
MQEQTKDKQQAMLPANRTELVEGLPAASLAKFPGSVNSIVWQCRPPPPIVVPAFATVPIGG